MIDRPNIYYNQSSPLHFLADVGFLVKVFFIAPLLLLAKVKNHRTSLL